MNVLVTLNSLILGGCPLNAIDLAATAERHGVRSVIVGYRSTLPPRGPSLLDAADERGIEVQVLDTSIATSSAGPALARIAEEHDIDLVHAYGGWISAPRSRDRVVGVDALSSRPCTRCTSPRRPIRTNRSSSGPGTCSKSDAGRGPAGWTS